MRVTTTTSSLLPTGGPACVRPLHRSIARAERYWIGRERERGRGSHLWQWRRERRLFGGRTCDRRFCGSVVHFCLSLFLSSFLPFLSSDRRPTLLLPRCAENCPDEECALTVRFGGFDSRIHFKKIESRNF